MLDPFLAFCCLWHSWFFDAVSEMVSVPWQSKNSNEFASLADTAMANCNIDLGPGLMPASSHERRTDLSHSARADCTLCNTLRCFCAVVCTSGTSMVFCLMSPLLKQLDVESASLWNDEFREFARSVSIAKVRGVQCLDDASTRHAWLKPVSSGNVSSDFQTPCWYTGR